MIIKRKNVKRKNAQTGKGANAIAYKILLIKNFLCTRIYKKEAIFRYT